MNPPTKRADARMEIDFGARRERRKRDSAPARRRRARVRSAAVLRAD
jgi:hypothetical protein